MNKIKNLRLWLVIAALLAANANIFFMSAASAGTLSKSSIQELGNGASFASPMVISAGQELAIDFKTATAGATTANINFAPAGYPAFTGGAVTATQVITSAGCTAYFPSATVLPGTLAASGSGSTLSITGITALAATTEYCAIIGDSTHNAITNPSSAGNYVATLTVGSDSSNIGYYVMSSAPSYTVTGTVPPSFTLSLGCASDSFASNFSYTALTVSNGCSVTVNTNAANGWNLYASDANSGLFSSTASKTIPSVAAGSNANMNTNIGSEKYAFSVSANNTANYASNTNTTGGALSSTAYYQVATSATTASNVSQTMKELVDISSTTPAANNYTDTIEVVGSGQF